ncbi:hypothetical protein P692DRAFT_20101406 [Suillus brevipes Sb2]|nr:hypothetical protein P692DRAFT_20101406 [Suillus brevipes Sb2]
MRLSNILPLFAASLSHFNHRVFSLISRPPGPSSTSSCTAPSVHTTSMDMNLKSGILTSRVIHKTVHDGEQG